MMALRERVAIEIVFLLLPNLLPAFCFCRNTQCWFYQVRDVNSKEFNIYVCYTGMGEKGIRDYVGGTYEGYGGLFVDGKKVAEVDFEVTIDTKHPGSRVLKATGKFTKTNVTDNNFDEPTPLETAVNPLEFEISGVLDLGDTQIETEFSGWSSSFPKFSVRQVDEIFRQF